MKVKIIQLVSNNILITIAYNDLCEKVYRLIIKELEKMHFQEQKKKQKTLLECIDASKR